MAKNLDLNCLKVVTKVGEKQYIIRGCQLAQQSNIDICHKIREANIDNQLSVVHCSRCAVDKCNLAPQIQTFPIYLTPLLIIRFVVLD
ncbi:uncharacterized protein LOC132699983 [Cylas formicarius]|uniref:uncharacterized protein LOC132699983 n=1 Tax=Cylas formicarius TaxID=197179 RepID=UPI002958D308|nr:uncharacterized protein LOC132699983 [Cylas formicarius]